jgi:hypothetical protein
VRANRTYYRTVCAVVFLAATTVSGGQNDALPSLKLRVEVNPVDQSYCHSLDGDRGQVEFKLTVTIHNEGGRPVLLCKKYVELDCPILNYAKTDGTAGDVAFELNCDKVYAVNNPTNFQKDYAMVQPGRNFSFDGVTAAWLRLPSSHANPKGLLTSGTYWLHPFVTTWDGTPEAAQILRGKWKKMGNLVSDTLSAEPILVTVKIPDNPSECR